MPDQISAAQAQMGRASEAGTAPPTLRHRSWQILSYFNLCIEWC